MNLQAMRIWGAVETLCVTQWRTHATTHLSKPTGHVTPRANLTHAVGSG